MSGNSADELAGRFLGAIFEGVGHGDDFDALTESKQIMGGAHAASAAADKATFNSSLPAAWPTWAKFNPPAKAAPAANAGIFEKIAAR